MIYCPAQNVDLMTNSSLLTSPDRIPQLGGFMCIEIRGTMSSVVHLSGRPGCRGAFISLFCLEKRLCLEPNTHFIIQEPLRYPLFINLEKKIISYSTKLKFFLPTTCWDLCVHMIYNIYSTHVYNFLDSVRGELTAVGCLFFKLLSQPTVCRNCSAKSASRH